MTDDDDGRTFAMTDMDLDQEFEFVTDSEPGAGVQTIFLHVGTMKTGTTYLQHRLSESRQQLKAHGVLWPARQFAAARDFFGRRGMLTNRRVGGGWSKMLEELHTSKLDRAVISLEILSTAEPERIRQIVEDFAPATVEVILTIRDVSAVIAAQWQETIQNEFTWTWDEYAAALTVDPDRSPDAATRFWRQHDVERIVADWAAVVGLDHVHVITVPPPGAPSDLLWERFCSVVGVDPSAIPPPEKEIRTNTGLDAASAEVVRRINERVAGKMIKATYIRHVKHLLGKETLVGRGPKAKPTLTPDQHAWAIGHTDRLVGALRASNVDIVGDEADLQPAALPTEAPDVVNDSALLEVALDSAAALLRRLDEMEALVQAHEPGATKTVEEIAEKLKRDRKARQRRMARAASGAQADPDE